MLIAVGDRDHKTLGASVGLALAALAWRIHLATVYDGHEEEDWGNLEIVRGVLDSGFAYVETEHMPLFAWLAAIAARLTGDVQLGCLVVAVTAGAVAVGLAVWIGERHLAPGVGIVAGVALAVQPEAALYSATPLRESLYLALTLGAILAVAERRAGWAGALLALAFLARFNAAFTLLPALAWVAWRTEDPAERKRLLVAVAAVAAVVLLWAGFYRAETGSWAFWGRVVAVNTGDAVGDLFPAERVAAVAGAVAGVFGRVLPGHVGWLVVPLAVLGGVRITREGTPAARWIGLCTAATLALLAVTAVMTTYEWRHNLWWKWITPSVPLVLLLAAHGAWSLASRKAVLGVVAVVTLVQYHAETRRQIELSDAAYGTQVALVQWVEDAFPAGTAVLAEGIPASYLRARRSAVPLARWTDDAVPADSPDALGAWLVGRRVGLVLWYREEWTGAPDKAGFLADVRAQRLGPATLEPLVDEQTYGLIAYRVAGPGVPVPSAPPPDVAGRID